VADKTVPPNQSQRLYDAYKAEKLDVALHIVPNAKHQIEPFLTPENEKLAIEFLNRKLRP